MPACPLEIEVRLYEDALLELGQTGRAFAAAIERAVELGARIPDETSGELAGRILDECRAALLPAFARAPGMLQLFATPK